MNSFQLCWSQVSPGGSNNVTAATAVIIHFSLIQGFLPELQFKGLKLPFQINWVIHIQQLTCVLCVIKQKFMTFPVQWGVQNKMILISHTGQIQFFSSKSMLPFVTILRGRIPALTGSFERWTTQGKKSPLVICDHTWSPSVSLFSLCYQAELYWRQVPDLEAGGCVHRQRKYVEAPNHSPAMSGSIMWITAECPVYLKIYYYHDVYSNSTGFH